MADGLQRGGRRPMDPRGRGFKTRARVDDVIRWIDRSVGVLGSELARLGDAAGRVLAESVVARVPVPPFDRAAMDGYAIRGEESFGAGEYSPAAFRIIGVARPGRPFEGEARPSEAVEVATGAPLPAGTDAVVPVESTSRDGEVVQITTAIPPGRHVGKMGEDVVPGAEVFSAGRRLRPQDIGILSALAYVELRVVQRPRVAILVTGDELLPAGSAARDSAIADMNSPMLEALVARDGGTSVTIGPLRDDRERLRTELARLARESDVILVVGGSSTGPEDHCPSLVAELGELNFHGIALRPASPAGIGRIDTCFVDLLPGNPVSCLCAYDLFAGRIIRRLGGRAPDWPYRAIRGVLAWKLVSELGRLDYVRVRLTSAGVEPIATSGAGILSSTTRADGFALVPPDVEGYPEGAEMVVHLYDVL